MSYSNMEEKRDDLRDSYETFSGGSVRGSESPNVKQISNITEDLKNMDDKLVLLQSALCNLESKVYVVLTSDYNEGNEKASPEPEASSPLDQSLKQIYWSIDSALQFVDRLTRRIDL